MRRTLVALAAAAMLSMPMVGSPSEALAQKQDADGLVVVQIGNVTDTVDVNAAAALIVQACGIQALNNVNVLNVLSAIDNGAHQHTFCKGTTGPVTATNN
jgi:hypothetical protein